MENISVIGPESAPGSDAYSNYVSQNSCRSRKQSRGRNVAAAHCRTGKSPSFGTIARACRGRIRRQKLRSIEIGRISGNERRPRVFGEFGCNFAAARLDGGHFSRTRRSGRRNLESRGRSTMRFDRDDGARASLVRRPTFWKHDQRSAAQGASAGAAGAGGQVKVCFLTNEYPPHIYGGAGVHV